MEEKNLLVQFKRDEVDGVIKLNLILEMKMEFDFIFVNITRCVNMIKKLVHLRRLNLQLQVNSKRKQSQTHNREMTPIS